MAAPKIYLDEDVHESIAAALRLRGCEVLTTPEAGNRGADDEAPLRFGTAEGYALLVHNVADFARLHSALLRSGSSTPGSSSRQSEGTRNIRPLLNLLSQVSAEDLVGQLVYLANWKLLEVDSIYGSTLTRTTPHTLL